MLPDCYWVEEHRVLAGEHPAGYDARQTRNRVAALLDCGVRTFIDLTCPHERDPYEEILHEEAAARGMQVAYHRVEIRDHAVPSRAQMEDILSLIDEAIGSGAPVYVHCWAGIGRTGTVIGCWLTRRGRSADDAIEEIARLRRRTVYYDIRSPETPEQVSFVREWIVTESDESVE